ncbi:MAG TPA: DUF1501 domain-containing protein [Planctomycetaceae bacterium]|nr:DUF1501 domain-containing protein [Planctomycetaceae bacterium]
MLKVLGSAKRLCDGIDRREMLRAGSLGLFSAGLASLNSRIIQAGEAADDPTFGKAKRVILLYLYGAAAQHELYDLKPEAPAEIAGKFRPIETVAPGIRICEHLPHLAKVADRCTFIRSMTHPYNIHSAAYTLSGVEKVDIPMELGPYDPRHWPFFGSVVDYLAQQRAPEALPPAVPRNIALPFQFSSRSPQFTRGGPYGGFLGRAYNPIWTEFEGDASRVIQRWRGDADQDVHEYYAGIHPTGRFTLSKAAQLPAEVTLDRLNSRRSLAEQLDRERRSLDASPSVRSLDRFQEMAYSLITSTEIRNALDLTREPKELRERYGMTLFGQATLAGRRLLEAGATVVSVFWDEITTANSAWDTHFNHFERLERELLPGLDRALSSLIVDLEDRGMLDDTLILCLTEHGRTPRLSNTPRGAGREHWSDVYCNLVAGGGIARGKVIGSSDAHGAFVKDDPISPKDILCTTYHLLGIDPNSTIPDRLGRPFRLVSEGEVLHRILA